MDKIVFMYYYVLLLASIGNKTETIFYLFYSIFLSFPVVVGYSYYIRLQTYVFAIDLGFNIIGFVFVFLEIVWTVFEMFFIRNKNKIK